MRAIRTFFGELKAAFMAGVRTEQRKQAERFFVGEMDTKTEMDLLLEEFVEASRCDDPNMPNLLAAYTMARTGYFRDIMAAGDRALDAFEFEHLLSLARFQIDTKIIAAFKEEDQNG